MLYACYAISYSLSLDMVGTLLCSLAGYSPPVCPSVGQVAVDMSPESQYYFGSGFNLAKYPHLLSSAASKSHIELFTSSV